MTEMHAAPFAVITGASSGIGLELAKRLAEHGYDLLVTDESKRIDAAVAELRSLGAMGVQSVRADLSTFEGVESLYSAIRSAGRPVDAIAISSGTSVGGRFIENELDAELKAVALNVTSVVHLTKRIARDMEIRKEGRILIISPVAAKATTPADVVHDASQAFVRSFAKALRNELRNTNIVVTALQPEDVKVEVLAREGADALLMKSSDGMVPKARQDNPVAQDHDISQPGSVWE